VADLSSETLTRYIGRAVNDTEEVSRETDSTFIGTLRSLVLISTASRARVLFTLN